MAMERGGRSTKLGNTYERLWAVRYALYVLQGRATSLLWEPVGEDENGVDLWVTQTDGTRNGYQLKRENESKEYWSVADLRDAGVLRAARQQLDRQDRSRYSFVSSSGVRHLRDLAEQSRRANNDPVTFQRDLVATNVERTSAFKTLLVAWNLDHTRPADVATAFGLLQRMTFEVQERTQEARDEVGFIAGLFIVGEPATIVGAIGDLLDNNLGKDFHADDLRRMLMAQGFEFRLLAGDGTLAASIDRLQTAFDSAIASSLIASVPIPRPEVDDLLAKVRADNPARLMFVHGGAGAGKSVVLHQAFMALRSTVPCLPVQLHARPPSGTPNSFGRSQLGLPASPALCLRGLAGARQAILILDQLDAVRLTSSNSHAAWQSCADIIDEALADPGTTVIVACRTFDLENDPKIAAWKRYSEQRPAGTVAEFKVGDLPEPAVNALIAQHGLTFASMPARQQRLLRQPGPLALWWNLASAGEVTTPDNATSLMRAFLALRRRECVRDHGVTDAALAAFLEAFVSHLDGAGTLAAPEVLFVAHGAVIEALCSVGVLRRDGLVLSFAHQSYFDYLVAEQVMRSAFRPGGDPMVWVRANQSLFRRDQLRQLLTLLRDADPARHETLTRSVLLDPDLRFHLKHLVLGLLSQADPPLDHEVRLVTELAERPEWWDHVYGTILWSKVSWFDALMKGGHLGRWLSSWTGEERLRSVLRLLRPMAELRGDAVDTLLEPYWGAGEPWTDRFAEVATINPADDSPKMAVFRVRQVRAGLWNREELWLDQVADRKPQRVIPLLEAALLSWDDRVRSYMANSAGSQMPEWRFREDRLGPKVLAAVSANGQDGWAAFSKIVRNLRLLQRVVRRGVRDTDGTRNVDWSLNHRLDEAVEFAETLVAASVRGLAQSRAADVAAMLSLQPHKIKGMEHAIATGLAEGDLSLADNVAGWLCARPDRFCLGDGYKQLRCTPAVNLIRRFAPACSEPAYAALEKRILAFHDDHERFSMRHQRKRCGEGVYYGNEWGKAQHHLLSAVPTEQLSEEGRLRAATWRAKFGDPAKELPLDAHGSGGWVGSPIPANKLGFVSDRVWLDIIARQWPPRGTLPWKQLDSDTLAEASATQFARSLGTAVRAEPKRFAKLALRLPASTGAGYLTSMLDALSSQTPPDKTPGWEAASDAELEAVVAHVGTCDDADYVKALCRLLSSRKDVRWSDAMIDRVLAQSGHSDPAEGEFHMHGEIGPDGRPEPDLGGTAINCVRGTVADAMITLLWSRPDAFERLLPAVERLIGDPHPSVRYEAIGACLPIWNRDRDRAVQLLLKGCDHPDDRVLASRWIHALIAHARYSHCEQIGPLVKRMVESNRPKVAEQGAGWATATHLQRGALSELYEVCRKGSIPQRKGVANAVQELSSYPESAEASVPILSAFFDDEVEPVRERAGRVWYRENLFDLSTSPALAEAFVRSRAFLDQPTHLLHPLAKYSGDIRPYANAIMIAAEVLAGPLAGASRDIRHRVGHAADELAGLLFRLYEHAYGSEAAALQKDCLDRWDLLLASRVGLTMDHLRKLDD